VGVLKEEAAIEMTSEVIELVVVVVGEEEEEESRPLHEKKTTKSAVFVSSATIPTLAATLPSEANLPSHPEIPSQSLCGLLHIIVNLVVAMGIAWWIGKNDQLTCT
jgi:hypothetical protein